MAARKSGLGRGLDSLFGDSGLLQKPTPIEKPKAKAEEKPLEKSVKEISPAKSAQSKLPVSEDSIVYIKLTDIKPNSAQPRKAFDDDALADLAASIKELGVIQPIMVRPAKKGYELVAGERRWRASRLAGLKEIPAIVKDIDEKTNAFYALVENMQREDLNAIEEAEGVQEIIDKYELTQDETAKLLGKSRPYITNALRLLKLPKEVQTLVAEGKLSQGHARAVAGLEGEALQIEAAIKAAKEGWSVRRIEAYTQSQPQKRAKPRKRTQVKKDAQTKAVEDDLSEKLGTRVVIEGSENYGKIELEYYSKDELSRLVELLLKD